MMDPHAPFKLMLIRALMWGGLPTRAGHVCLQVPSKAVVFNLLCSGTPRYISLQLCTPKVVGT
jgi:hypothetical protein